MTANSLSLRVLRPAGGVSFTGEQTSSAVAPAIGGSIQGPIPTQLPIKAGDAVGLDGSIGAIIQGNVAGATLDYWNMPPLANGSTRMGQTANNFEAPVQAVVEPDVDCDGRGDETQDSNLSDGACKTPPVQTLTAKRKQKLAKAAVSETLDKAGAVSLQARVKLPKPKTSSRALRVLARAVKSKTSSASLNANTKTQIKLRFSAKARKKIKAAIRDRGPRKAVVTATATDTFGNSSTSTVRFKLTG